MPPFPVDPRATGSASVERPVPSKSPAAGVESVTIRKASNGFIVDVNREFRGGKPPESSKPHVCDSIDGCIAAVKAAFGEGGGAQSAMDAPAGPAAEKPAYRPGATYTESADAGQPSAPPAPAAAMPSMAEDEEA